MLLLNPLSYRTLYNNQPCHRFSIQVTQTPRITSRTIVSTCYEGCLLIDDSSPEKEQSGGQARLVSSFLEITEVDGFRFTCASR